jgi:NitT/TauT family transport system ATP-binding protein
MEGVAKAECNDLAQELIELVGLSGFENRYPSELSGGMQQRVEIARVLVNHPRVLLMDEPFGALDAITRVKMQSLLLEVWTRIRTTVIFITHDIDEALFLADRVLIMSPRPGRIVDELVLPFDRPRNSDLVTRPDFVALKRRCLARLHHDGEDALERLTPLGEATQKRQPTPSPNSHGSTRNSPTLAPFDSTSVRICTFFTSRFRKVFFEIL